MAETNETGFEPWKKLTHEERVRVVTFLNDAGFTSKQMGEALQTDRGNISGFCRKYGIVVTRYRGAQSGNKNAKQTANGLAINTIQRLTRRILLKVGRDLFVCERCNKRSEGSEFPRHHKDRDRSNNDPTNLEVLCHACHALEHLNERGRNEQGQFACLTS